MNRRLFTPLLAAAVLLGPAVSTALAVEKDCKPKFADKFPGKCPTAPPPPASGCNDYTDSLGGTYKAESGAFEYTAFLAADACSTTSYVMTVRNLSDGTDYTLNGAPVSGSPSVIVFQGLTGLGPENSKVVFQATTSSGGLVIDTAPDYVLATDSPAGVDEDSDNNGYVDFAEIQDNGSPAGARFN